MVQGGGVDGREGSGSGVLPTESADISRRIRSNLLKTGCKRGHETRAIVFMLHLALELLYDV